MTDAPDIFQTLRAKTAPGLLAEHARNKPDTVAFRAKHLGIYRERTWRDYATLVGRCALGLRALGLARGERVAIMGDACEEWMICDLAAQALGAITYGIPALINPAYQTGLTPQGGIVGTRISVGIRLSHHDHLAVPLT